ncbi:MAG: DUF4440 domain-containing protein, partial [Pseudomonadota bacterium]
MKQKIVPTAFVAITLAACQPAPTAISEQDRLSIEESSRLWVKNYNENDWEALSNLFTPDEVLMPPNGPA